MNFAKHSEIKDSHALFGASKSSWLRYDIDKMIESYQSSYKTVLGTEIHDFAASQIILAHKQTSVKSIKENLETYIYRKFYDNKNFTISNYGKELISHLRYLEKDVFETVKVYINDAIGFRMTPEQPLIFSEQFFGTTDAISFRNNTLRIHDLKTGSTPAHMEQLEIYAALFCLEYDQKPSAIDMELRLYQSNEVLIHNPDAIDISDIMNKMIEFDKVMTHIRSEE